MTFGTTDDGGATRLGLGTGPLGNLFTAVPEEQALATVRAAWELGIRHVDTAPHYGLGLAEERLGRALREIGAARDELTVSTKVGRVLEPNSGYRHGQLDDAFAVPATLRRRWDPSDAGVRRSLEDSLERLGLDHVDTLYLHDPEAYDVDEGIARALPALVRLREEGLVRRVGVGSGDLDVLVRCVREADLDEVICANRYTLLEQPAAEHLLPLCLGRGVDVVAAGVYNSGALASATMPDDVVYEYAPAPDSVVARVRRLYDICRAHGVAVPAAAVQFAAGHPAVTTVLVGARHPDEVTAAVAHASAEIPDALWTDLLEQGLIAAVPQGR
ncbi:aldo/keto reductase [Georgenia sp. H159]|uniref:aldo/keto reductase n=1 Tax=Georgenia sp. H159 TaxID=3076115 RepID=UPI002D77853D|nr:aldo/keto reductase [Georgenia sp. H159]